MKILNLIIKKPNGDVVRNIHFNKIGISFVYGDIQDPKNLGATINSLGKTLLLKCIDYIFGANEDLSIMKKEIHYYVLEATVLFEFKKYVVQRILGNSENIYIDNIPYTLIDYRNYFKIKRSFDTKQLVLNKKVWC